MARVYYEEANFNIPSFPPPKNAPIYYNMFTGRSKVFPNFVNTCSRLYDNILRIWACLRCINILIVSENSAFFQRSSSLA